MQWLLPVWAWPLLALAAVACAVWAHRAYAASQPLPPPGARRLLVGLRTTACVLILLAVARPLAINLQTIEEPALLAVVVEDSGSMGLSDRLDGPDRWTEAWQLAEAISEVAAAQADDPQVSFQRGNGRLPLREVTPASARQEPPQAVGSDLPALVAQVRQNLLGRPLRGIVVLTDGHSEDQAPLEAPAGLPLWLIGVGDSVGPPDRFLASLRYPDRVQRNQPLIVEVAVADQQIAGSAQQAPVTVRLLHEGEVVDVQTGPAADLTHWELAWTPTETGLVVLEVEVDPLDNERFLTNNRATLAVDVEQDQARILVLAPVPGWDVRFLTQAAQKEPRLVASVVRPGPAGPVLADSLQAWQPPPTAAAWLERWDAVVLAGPPGAWLPDGGAQLATAVRQGLPLVTLAGDPGTDLQPRVWPPALQAVLPVVLSGQQQLSGEFAVQVAPAALRHPILAGVTHGPAASGILERWPPLRRLQPVRAQPQAEVLLQAGNDQPLLVVGTPESGRSLWFGGRRLWELSFWRLPGRETTGLHEGDRLLRQMLLWSALGDQTAGISLLGQRLVLEEGEILPVAARWLDLRGEPVTGRSLAVEIMTPEGAATRLVPLQPDPVRPGVATGELPPLPPGRWQLVPRSLESPVETGPAREVVVTQAERELAQVRQDRRNLRQTAARLGGVALDAGRPDQVDRLLAAIADLDLQPAPSWRQSRLELMAGWPWLIVAVLFLAGEWLLRRRYGLL